MSDKNYFIMLANPPAEGPVANAVKEPDVYTNRGNRIGEVEGDFVYTLDIAKHADPRLFPPLDIERTGHHLLFSKKMTEVLCDAGVTNIEYFDTLVTYTPTEENIEYKVANIIGKLAGFDLQASKYKIDEDDEDDVIYGISKIVFDESKFNNQMIFRLKEKSMLIVVREDVKIALESAGITGLLFVKDEEWKRGMI